MGRCWARGWQRSWAGAGGTAGMWCSRCSTRTWRASWTAMCATSAAWQTLCAAPCPLMSSPWAACPSATPSTSWQAHVLVKLHKDVLLWPVAFEFVLVEAAIGPLFIHSSRKIIAGFLKSWLSVTVHSCCCLSDLCLLMWLFESFNCCAKCVRVSYCTGAGGDARHGAQGVWLPARGAVDARDRRPPPPCAAARGHCSGAAFGTVLAAAACYAAHAGYTCCPMLPPCTSEGWWQISTTHTHRGPSAIGTAASWHAAHAFCRTLSSFSVDVEADCMLNAHRLWVLWISASLFC